MLHNWQIVNIKSEFKSYPDIAVKADESDEIEENEGEQPHNVQMVPDAVLNIAEVEERTNDEVEILDERVVRLGEVYVHIVQTIHYH